MIAAPIPPDEVERLRTLCSLDVLDTAPDPVLDGLTRSAAALTGCPIALVSLIDAERQWFKARVGMKVRQTPRDTAFCAHSILGNAVMEIPDARLDPRFADNPLVVGEPHMRFYAGAPITVDGRRIGTLCVIDRKPRDLSAEQRSGLVDLARAVEHWMLSLRQRHDLDRSDAYRRSLFEQLGDAVIVFDDTFRLCDANPAMLSMFGYDREELLRLTVRNLLPGFEHGRFDRNVARTLAGDVHLASWEQVRKDGKHFPAEVSVRKLEDGRYLAVVRDITERRQQEQQLRQLSMAVEQSAQSIVISNLAGRIEYLNAAAMSSSGYGRDELIDRPARVFLSKRVPVQTLRAMRQCLASGKSWKGLLYNHRKDGTEYVVQTTVTPVRMPDGRVTHYLSVMEDVTEKQRIAEELDKHRHHLEELVCARTAELALAKQAAEAANEAKSSFLATMSHEIRTPMNGVVGIIDVLRQSSLTPYQVDLADTIRESAFSLLAIIDDILDFSKIEAGRLTLEREPVELLRLVEAVCDSLQPVADTHGVQLQVFVDPRLPAFIASDTHRLRQILNNLLGNAIKFSTGLERRGLVRLRVEPDAGDRLRLQVADNGIGISTSALTRIFKPFEQAEGSTTRRYGGTGLGLSISQRLVQLFGGELSVSSSLGAGATFTATLPMQAEIDPKEPACAGDLSGVECLVSLRDPRQAQDWCATLAAAGARATVAQDPTSPLADPAASVPNGIAVAIVETDPDDAALERVQARYAGSRVRLVRVARGRRRGARLLLPGVVLLDTDAVRRAALLKAVALAAGRASPEPEEIAGTLNVGAVTPPARDAAEAQGRLILVAEDNEINQEVIRHQLALFGLAAEIADNGLEALDRWRTGRYGLLLTDLHMPGLDGYELAASIRREEGEGAHLPIIALTANAMIGEAERCRDSGMDDYLSKPVALDRLGAVLRRWLPDLPSNKLSVALSARASDNNAPAVLDRTVLARMVGNDPALMERFQRDFLGSARTATEDLRAAVARQDWTGAGGIAHRLKSSARTVGAMALGNVCEQIETAGDAGEGCAVTALAGTFETAMALVAASLSAGFESPGGGPASIAAMTEPTVVLVDDEPFQLQVLQHQLSMLGATSVQSFRSGPTALAWLDGRDTSALLLLLDLDMPEMDGIEFMRHLAERRYAGALALVSGSDQRLLETAAKLAAAHHLAVLSHLQKPVLSDTLRALVERWHAYIPAQERLIHRSYTPRELQHALDAGELVLHYQPKVALADGALTGVEALVRWQHPVDGLLYPDSFIAMAEGSGLIDALTRTVLSQALRQARRWHDDGLQIRMAVNISMDNLERLDFLDFVVDEVARHGVPPGKLVLEVTESRLMRDVRAPMDSLARLRLKGIGLSIDDFGTGHSSLSQLRDLPFDELKIDGGFVHGNHHDATQSAIFKGSLSMAHQLGMRAVAEGVEDQADWDFVRAAGCDVAQGYFIGRPMPADALPAWFEQWRKRFETV